ncbi:MAG: translation initiation factor IF-2 [Limisphaerales bacterium]
MPPRPSAPGPAEALSGEEIIVKPPITVRELAEVLKRKPFQVIADLMELGIFANVNQSLEADVAQRVAARRGVRLRVRKREEGGGVTQKPEPKQATLDLDDKPEDLQPRAPVVTIMGHVDHGKTTLLDVIRKTNVAAGEAGGITQHIGAYTISVPHPERAGEMQQITFLDTPGHAAFSAMRARGANVTDIVILVVAANDGVMPQTLEALNHARAARVPIVVAVNKSDHPAANAMRVRQQLQERGLTPDTWGGDTIFVDVSALTKVGVDKLLEALVVQADLLELRANPNRKAKGNVIESGVEPGGPTATVLVRKGTLRVGDVLLCGKNYGRVRALISEDGKRSKEAGPSVAVRVLGLDGVPNAGIEFDVVENERMARNLSEQREEAEKGEDRQRGPKVRMEDFWRAFQEGSAKVLKVVVKADTQGSVEAIVDALTQIKSDKVSLEIIGDGVGTIAQDDILLASASKAVILGFHTRVDNAAAELAKREGVQIKLYAIIYELIDEVKDAMAGLLDPLLKEVVFGTAQVRKVFALSKGGNVAGCVIASGRVVKGKARLVRRNSTIFEGIIFTLRRFQDEVNEVRAGMECGIRLDGFDDFQEGDTIECYNLEKIPQKL